MIRYMLLIAFGGLGKRLSLRTLGAFEADYLLLSMPVSYLVCFRRCMWREVVIAVGESVRAGKVLALSL